MKGVLPLPLQGLNRERAFEGHLSRLKKRGPNHLRQQGQELPCIFYSATEAQHERVLLRIAAQTCSASLDKVRQVHVVVLAAAPAKQGCQ